MEKKQAVSFTDAISNVCVYANAPTVDLLITYDLYPLKWLAAH